MAIGYYSYPQIDYRKTGQNLKRLCRKQNYSVREIQSALGLASNQAIYDWFNGKSLPSLNNFYALSQLLNTSMEDLIYESLPERPQEPEVECVEYIYARSNRNYTRVAEYDRIVHAAEQERIVYTPEQNRIPRAAEQNRTMCTPGQSRILRTAS